MNKLIVLICGFMAAQVMADGKVDIDVLPAKDPQGLNNGISQKGLNKVGKANRDDMGRGKPSLKVRYRIY